MRPILLAALLAVIAGCAAQSATLPNNRGEHRYCYKSTTGAISNIGAMQEYNKCLNEQVPPASSWKSKNSQWAREI
jgi:hypothetical protein